MKVSILDYGMGNIKSVANAIKFLGYQPKIVRNDEEPITEKIIIPGVGAFGDAMRSLRSLIPIIVNALESGSSILGICLGMQVFFEGSDESPDVKGLNILKGKVRRIETDYNLPQIGWNSLEITAKGCPLFRDVSGGYVYYANSYHVKPDKNLISAVSNYGEEVTASVWKNRIYGTQFHPEKSGKIGLKLLKNRSSIDLRRW